MPRSGKSSKKRNDSDASTTTEDVERDIASAEADAGIQSEESVADENVGSGDDAPEPDDAPPPPPEARSRRGRTPEASISIAAKGPASKVREALDRVTGGDVERAALRNAAEREALDDGDADFLAELLQDPRHMVVVHREFPKRWRGKNSALRCEKHSCPITLDTIKEDTFARYGGKSFRVTVHPNTTTGESKTIFAITIVNPDSDEPLDGNGEPLVPEPDEVTLPVDPMLVDDPDPMARLDHELNRQVDMVTKVGKIKSTRKLLKTLDEDDEDVRRREPAVPAQDPEIALLRKQVQDMTVEQRMEKRQAAFEDRIMQALEAIGGQKKGGNDNALLIAMMQSSDQKFTTMMSTFMPLIAGQNKKTDDLDSMLTRLGRVKEVLGGDNSKVKTIEAKIMEKMMDRFLDGDGGSGDGSVESGVVEVAKTALKEGMPVIKTLVDQRGQQTLPAPAGPSVHDFQKAVAMQAQKIVESPEFIDKLRKEWEAKGFVVKGLPTAGTKPGLPGPTPAAEGEKPKPAMELVKEDEEDDDMDLPPGPTAAGYDRKVAVDYVLDSMIEEMKTCTTDGYVLGDILDRLDSEILHGLLNVNTGEDLENLIGPYADAAKLGEIKAAGQLNPAIKDWLSSIILSAKKEYRQSLDAAGRKEQEEAAKEAAAAAKAQGKT